MRALIWFVVLFALGVGASMVAQHNVAEVWLVFPSETVQVSLNFAILVGVLACIGLYFLWRTVVFFRHLPKRLRQQREKNEQQKALTQFLDALRLFFEESYPQAFDAALLGHTSQSLSGVSALIAAEAALRMGETEKAREWVRRTIELAPQMKLACCLIEVRLYAHENADQDALSKIDEIRTLFGVALPDDIAALEFHIRDRLRAKHEEKRETELHPQGDPPTMT